MSWHGEIGVNQKLIFSNTEGGLVSKKQVYIAIRNKGERGVMWYGILSNRHK